MDIVEEIIYHALLYALFIGLAMWQGIVGIGIRYKRRLSLSPILILFMMLTAIMFVFMTLAIKLKTIVLPLGEFILWLSIFAISLFANVNIFKRKHGLFMTLILHISAFTFAITQYIQGRYLFDKVHTPQSIIISMFVVTALGCVMLPCKLIFKDLERKKYVRKRNREYVG